MEKSLTFRNAELADINVIMAIEKSCFKQSVMEEKSVFEKRIKLFPDGFVLMCEDNEIIGYACGEIWSEKLSLNEKTFALGHNPFETHNVNGTKFYISSMGIFEKNRGGGKGKLLFNKLIENIIKKYPLVNELVLIVAEDWEPALNIYKKQGFEEMFVLSGFFKPDNELEKNGIVMNKKLFSI